MTNQHRYPLHISTWMHPSYIKQVGKQSLIHIEISNIYKYTCWKLVEWEGVYSNRANYATHDALERKCSGPGAHFINTV